MMDLTTMLLYTKDVGGSDLHVSAGAPIMIRVNGETRRLARHDADRPLIPSPRQARRLIYALLNDAQKRRLEGDQEIDFALSLGEELRFRANVFYQQRGLSGVFRILPADILSFDALGLPKAVREFSDLEKGLVLVTGPTGSGKSTTLAAILDAINKKRRQHILTIEDPIEFIHKPKKCMINQRELSSHTHSFKRALKSGLREDPDIILVGEMRDLETIGLAITAAETGHLVFSTLHTSSASQTIERMVNVFPEGEQAQIRAMVSYSLAGIVSQILLPKIGGGRVAAYEVLIATAAVRSLIREAKTAQIPTAIQTGKSHGMKSLDQALGDLVARGDITKELADHQRRARGISTGSSDSGSHNARRTERLISSDARSS